MVSREITAEATAGRSPTSGAHTPGPWRVCKCGVISDRCLIVADDTLKPGDARLIAAAPDMLAALRGAEREMELVRHGQYNDWTLLKALNDVSDALAKAEGQS